MREYVTHSNAFSRWHRLFSLTFRQTDPDVTMARLSILHFIAGIPIPAAYMTAASRYPSPPGMQYAAHYQVQLPVTTALPAIHQSPAGPKTPEIAPNPQQRSSVLSADMKPPCAKTLTRTVSLPPEMTQQQPKGGLQHTGCPVAVQEQAFYPSESSGVTAHTQGATVAHTGFTMSPQRQSLEASAPCIELNAKGRHVLWVSKKDVVTEVPSPSPSDDTGHPALVRSEADGGQLEPRDGLPEEVTSASESTWVHMYASDVSGRCGNICVLKPYFYWM